MITPAPFEFDSRPRSACRSRCGAVIKCREINAAQYRVDAPQAVVDALEVARSSRQRVRLVYGWTEEFTPNPALIGMSWKQEEHVNGFVIIGNYSRPMLETSTTSRCAFEIFDNSVLEIASGKTILYRHPKYMPAPTVADPEPSRHWAAVARHAERLQNPPTLMRRARSLGARALRWITTRRRQLIPIK